MSKNSEWLIIKGDLEAAVSESDRPNSEMHAWLAFVDHVFTSGWWGTNSDIQLAWLFFQAGYSEAYDDDPEAGYNS